MQLQERIRQEVDITGSNTLALGPALSGYAQLVVDDVATVSYLITNADGTQYEFGRMEIIPDYAPGVDGFFRDVLQSNMNSGAGFTVPTSDLVLSIVVGSPNLVANTGSEGPSASGTNAAAIGSGAVSAYGNSTAIGHEARSAMACEVAFGTAIKSPWESMVSVSSMLIDPSSSGELFLDDGSAAPSLNEGLFGVGADVGVAAVRGTLAVLDYDRSAASVQVYEIALVLYLLDPVDGMLQAGSVTATPQVSTGPNPLTFSFNAGTGMLVIANGSVDTFYTVSGVLRITRAHMKTD